MFRYRPLLAKIKAEYDAAVSAFSRRADSQRPKETKLAVLEAETSEEIDTLRESFFRETFGLREALKASQVRAYSTNKTSVNLSHAWFASQVERDRLISRVDKYARESKQVRALCKNHARLRLSYD